LPGGTKGTRTTHRGGEETNADRFEEAYRETPPWDIGRAQPALEQAAADGLLQGPVLDAGCGTGENALFFAARGFEVVGVDAVEAAVAAARAKAQARGLPVEFLVHDALALGDLGRRFHTVVDSGLFHTFDDEERRRYVTSLAAASAPGARVLVLCFSEHQPGEGGPRRVTQAELREAFDRPPFRVVSIAAAEMATNLGSGRKAWLAIVERTAAAA
jgi:cyclopropane fatty-acyl-phospholipid synthase-like methyltransferase